MASTRQKITAAVIIVACTIFFFAPLKIGFDGSEGYGPLLFHFFHANWAHLALNMWALWIYKPKWHTAAVGYIVATYCACLPICTVTEPTYGLSAFLFACYARTYALWHIPLRNIILPQLLFGLLPHMNWRIHLAAFLVSYVYWRIYYGRSVRT